MHTDGHIHLLSDTLMTQKLFWLKMSLKRVNIVLERTPNIMYKKTPVWRNKYTGQIIFGSTLKEALIRFFIYNDNGQWVRASRLPNKDRIVVNADGNVFPKNDFSLAVARAAEVRGLCKFITNSSIFTVHVNYVDGVKVILGNY